MSRLIAIVAVSLVAGFAAAFWFAGVGDGQRAVLPTGNTAFENGGVNTEAGIFERLQALESALGVEREARQLLEEELLVLYEILDARDPPQALTSAEAAAVEAEAARDLRSRRRATSADDRSARVQALTDAGLSAERAKWIVERESALQMQMMQDRYEAMRENYPESNGRFFDEGNSLRAEIGDDDYAMYLEANNRPTTIGVRSVLEASPANTAGLQPGDQITYYDGVRVFDIGDLTRQTMRGEPGESVVVTVVRDGAPMQVVMPRGPLGIMSRRGR